MNRQQRRASGNKEKMPTYNFTEAQINEEVQKRFGVLLENLKVDAVNDAFALMLVIPLEVLMNHYWEKSYQKRLPGFINHVLQYYADWEDGTLNIEDLKKDLWEFGGVRFEVDHKVS